MFCLGAIVCLIGSARLNFLGEPYHRYAKTLIPFSIPGVDLESPLIPLIFSFQVEGMMGKRDGKLGAAYFSGDRIFLTFKVGAAAWVTLFGVDSKNLFPMFRKKFEPSLVEKDSHSLNFKLDQTEGNEIYYVIASNKKFNFEKDIRPHLNKIFPKGNSKGMEFSPYHLPLGEKFVQQYIYFQHLKRP